jgi:hypothetical protein
VEPIKIFLKIMDFQYPGMYFILQVFVKNAVLEKVFPKKYFKPLSIANCIEITDIPAWIKSSSFSRMDHCWIRRFTL